MIRHLFILMSFCSLLGCTSSEYNAKRNSSNAGLPNIHYAEPESADVATLFVQAPKLKTKLGFTDRMSVSFFDSCTDKDSNRKSGYIGAFELSSDENVGKSREVKIPANKTFYVEVGYAYPDIQCTNKFALTPAPGQYYRITWEYNFGVCTAAGEKRSLNGRFEPSLEIDQRKNIDGFWVGGSGRTTTEWRSCNTD